MFLIKARFIICDFLLQLFSLYFYVMTSPPALKACNNIPLQIFAGTKNPERMRKVEKQHEWNDN